MINPTQATCSYCQKTTASPMNIWAIWVDVTHWRDWNAGLRDCSIEGPFVQGSWLSMVMPDHEVIQSQIVEVQVGRRFIDETRLGDVTVRVLHEIERLSSGDCKVTYTAEVIGQNATEICEAVSSDFSEVLSALVVLAESKISK